MSGTRLRSPVVLLALVACVCSASAPVIGDVQAPARQPSVTMDVVYGDGLAAQFSPIRLVSSGSAPSLIVHGDADTAVPIDQGETMYAALTKAGVPASFIRMEGAGHGFEGAAPADLERAYAALVQWFEQHLGSAVK
jgi:dipeptidyl aminopeptidase/acylaminoacyl peptidase